MSKKPVPFQFSYDGSCAPVAGAVHASGTFSYGVFQWLPKSIASMGVKKSRAFVRIRGHVYDQYEVEKITKEICRWLNSLGIAKQISIPTKTVNATNAKAVAKWKAWLVMNV